MNFELAHPTRQQVRQGVVSGMIAESIAVPVLIASLLVSDRPARWAYLIGAAACLLATVVFLALFTVLSDRDGPGDRAVLSDRSGRSDRSGPLRWSAGEGFIVACLALTALALLAMGLSDRQQVFQPAVMVGVVFVAVIGDRRMRIGIDVFAVVLIGVTGWFGGERGSTLVAMLIVYASAVTIVTWIIARRVGELAEHVNFRQGMASLHEAFDELGWAEGTEGPDLARRVIASGLPFVAEVLPVEAVAVVARSMRLGAVTVVATWPAPGGAATELADLPALAQALQTGSVVLTEAHCVIPLGTSADGELAMVVRRSPSERSAAQVSEAADYLAAAFVRAVSRANLVTGLQTESRTDPLTGLANRRMLFDRIQMEMDHALRTETPLSLAMIDLDHFKEYNDRFGHVAGDTVLRSLAALMVSNVRGQDLVVRYGGEEFCLIMPDTDIVGGHHLLDKLRAGGRDATSNFAVTLSAGLTSWDGIEDATALIQRADEALYRAKGTGRDRVVSIQSFTEP